MTHEDDNSPITVEPSLLYTAEITVSDSNGHSQKAYALFDTGAQHTLINTHGLHHLRFQTCQTQNRLRIGGVEGKNAILIDKVITFSFLPKKKPYQQIKTQGLLVPGIAQWAAASPTTIPQWIQRYKGSLADERLASGTKQLPFDIIFDHATSKWLLGKFYGRKDKDGFCVEHTLFGIFVTGRS